MRLTPLRILLCLLGLVVAAVLLIAVTNLWMLRTARARVHPVDSTPPCDVAVVLGTSPTVGKRANPFFEGRMDTAAALYHSGKVRHLLVSGDNRRADYDEPTAMRSALVSRGVPAQAITLDYAGFRTLDTMARAARVFQLRQATIVTDDFHMARCLFLAREHGLEAFGCPSKPVSLAFSKKTRLREIAARTAAWIDVFLLRTKPKFYGPPIAIELS